MSISLFASDWVSGEILIILKSDVKDDAYDDFKLSYTDYGFKEIEIISKRLNLVHFSFKNEKITDLDFLSLISKYQY
jgi:hypothetical protein